MYLDTYRYAYRHFKTPTSSTCLHKIIITYYLFIIMKREIYKI